MSLDPTLKRKTLKKLLRHGATTRAARLAEKLPPKDIEEVLAVLASRERVLLTELLMATPQGVAVLRELPEKLLDQLLQSIPDARLTELAPDLPSEVTALILQHLPTTRCRCVCNALQPEHLRSVDSHLRAPRLSAVRARMALLLARRREG
jgi:Mg/Co/Ni transporter MgtE